MITDEHIKKDFTPYQIAKYEKMINDNSSIDDGFSDLCVKLKLLGSLGLDDISEDLSYSIYLYIEDLEDTIKALQIRANTNT